MVLIISLAIMAFSLSANSESITPIEMSSARATERNTYDWNPSYTINLPAFNSQNRAFFRGRGVNPHDVPPLNIELFNSAGIRRRSFRTALLEHFPANTQIESTNGGSGRRFTSGVFNSADEYFTLFGVNVKTPGAAKSERAWVLLWTGDAGISWRSYVIARESEFRNHRCPNRYDYNGSCEFPDDVDISRNFSPSAIQGNMPSFLLYFRTSTGSVPIPGTDSVRRHQYGQLALMTLTRNQSGVVLPPRYIPLSSNVLGIGSHSGGTTKIIRHNNKIYVAWVATTASPSSGSPTVVAMYDIASKRLVKKTVAYTFPANDSHNQPGITMTSRGILHLITGSHNLRMQHTYTLAANSIRDWTPPVPMRLSNEQTYISMIIDSKDKIHTVYRRWIKEQNESGDDITYGTLTYQQFDGQTWSEPKVLLYPSISGYFAFYQYLTIDRRDNLYLSYSRWSTQAPYCLRNAGGDLIRELIPQFSQVALLKSEDSGAGWFLPSDNDLIN